MPSHRELLKSVGSDKGWHIFFPGLPIGVAEYRFHAERRWRFDYAWPSHKIAIEQEGGVFVQGRHSRGAGMVKDMEKYNNAALLGWRVFRFTPQQIKSGEACQFMLRVFPTTRA